MYYIAVELNPKHFDSLNPKQREAVEHKDGPLLIIAGAGAGKTRVITHRIAHLIAQGIKPENILAVTFTNKAAAEMKERVATLLPEGSRLPFVGTFHGLGVHILRESGRAVEVSKWFTILDRDDAISIIRKAEKALGIDPKYFEPKNILGRISREKGNLVSRQEFESREIDNYFGETVSKVWREYEKELKKQGALDFDDLLVETVRLLSEHEPIRKRYQSQWKYIHIDEYQDTNKAQYELIRLLTGEEKNICVVGDHDQTIYTWRGATIENIMGFETDFPGAKVVLLEENYRSTSNILNAANAVIVKNRNRKEKNLFTSMGEGEKIAVHTALDALSEAEFVVEQCKKIGKKTKLEEIAVLYRANFQSRVLEEAFLRDNVPYTVLGTRFFERAEIRDVLSYIRAAMNELDRASFERAAGAVRRGLGEKSLHDYFDSGIKSEKIEAFLKLLAEIREKLISQPLPEAIKAVIKLTGYEEMQKGKGDEGIERLENVRELVNLSSKYKGLPNEEAISTLLAESALVSDQDTLLTEKKDKKAGVRLMTVHAAKGLEFDHVFIVGLEQGLFPHERMDDEGMTREREEEERRLFYVAITRARKKLWLSHAETRQIYGEIRVQSPSEYLSDIPEELLEAAEEILPTYQIGEIGSPRSRSRGLLPDIEDLE